MTHAAWLRLQALPWCVVVAVHVTDEGADVIVRLIHGGTLRTVRLGAEDIEGT